MNITVPYMDIPARLAWTQSGIDRAVLDVLHSGQFIGGGTRERCEAEVADLFGLDFGVGVNSGTSALRMALQAVGVRPGDEVILPAVSFVATYEAIAQLGATPVIVDVQRHQPLICNRAIERAITTKTKAIVPVHLFGNFASVEDFGVSIVDDAAQALGSCPITHGEIAALSFYPTKIVGGIGDGGMVLCQSEEVAAHVRALGNHGLYSDGHCQRVHDYIPGNARLDTIQAAAILAQLPDLKRRISVRQDIAARYDDVIGVEPVPRMVHSNIAIYALLHPNRDHLRRHLLEAGIQTAIYYPIALSQHPLVKDQVGCPNAEAFCSAALALPCHGGLNSTVVEHIICSLNAYFRDQ